MVAAIEKLQSRLIRAEISWETRKVDFYGDCKNGATVYLGHWLFKATDDDRIRAAVDENGFIRSDAVEHLLLNSDH